MERIEKILKNKQFQKYIQENSIKEKDRKFCPHDLEHLISVARIAYLIIIEQDKSFARDVVYAAGLLHDIGRWEEYETGKDHAQASAELSVEILTKSGFTGKEREEIVKAVEEHRGKNGDNLSFLGKILHQADMLSRPCWQCKARGECYKYADMPTREGLQY